MRKLKGFTLIELMIVVAIIAILAMIAYPSYVEHVRKTRRVQAKADMLELSQMLERRFTTERSYANFTLPTGFDQSPHTGAKYYDIRLDSLTATTYTIVAAPVAPQDTDTKCLELKLNHLGLKEASGSLGRDGCW